MSQPRSSADRVYLVTGANAGIGYFTTERLAATGATVVLGSRSAERAESAMDSIRARVPGARVRSVALDLADQGSLRETAASLDVGCLDAVVHNAGVLLEAPERKLTGDGHEMHFGTNHLGHFTLTHWLMPLLEAAPGARIVTVGSFAAKSERLDLDDLQSQAEYRAKRTYARSKLAQMYFGLELDRRLRAAGSAVTSVVVHPGGALDSLTPSRPPVHIRNAGAMLRAAPAALVLQGKHAGARPAARAVLDPRIAGGELWGPRVFGLRGRPHRERLWAQLEEAGTARRLWDASAELTGVDPAAGCTSRCGS
ncbi:SDR family NAD(P)-dependent oxidoreductase [Streptomyces sp. NPDC048109]|uniref:SDR family NAD(P)-dependent oxidoreductase n=1 Tax=unclassified Streptomyces TaxID=2593676 RepID=UPI0033E5BF87